MLFKAKTRLGHWQISTKHPVFTVRSKKKKKIKISRSFGSEKCWPSAILAIIQ